MPYKMKGTKRVKTGDYGSKTKPSRMRTMKNSTRDKNTKHNPY